MANPPDTAEHDLDISTTSMTERVPLKTAAPGHEKVIATLIELIHIRKKVLLPPLSSMISTRPGFNCSMVGTWFARTPISPDSAGRLT